MIYNTGKVLYHNPLSTLQEVSDFVLEGEADISFDHDGMLMQNALDESLGQSANFVYWCKEDFPDNIEISWDFTPLREPGLCIMFFAAKSRRGGSIWDADCAVRKGEYQQYHHGDINALHIAYYRRRYAEERAFALCNLRKSYGGHIVAQGADPLPPVADAKGPYRIRLAKRGAEIGFFINDLPILHWCDDGQSTGEVLRGGKLGFRQMAPLVARYANLTVKSIED